MLNLPELVKIPDDAISQVPELFKIFKRDFIDNVTYFMAYPVIIPRPREGEIYPEIFWHIISRQEQKGSKSNDTRGIDYERAKRLCWIKPIIQNFRDEEITCWKTKEFDKKAGKELRSPKKTRLEHRSPAVFSCKYSFPNSKKILDGIFIVFTLMI